MTICKVDQCTREIEKHRGTCSMHHQRWRYYKSYELPQKPDIKPGFVKACRVHGQLKPEDCLIKKRSRAKTYKNTTQNIYQCKACARARYHKWRKKNPDARKKEYELHKREPQRRDSYYAIRLKKLYGMTLDEYNAKYEAQHGLCAICNKPETKRDKRYGQITRLAVDHCHKTGKNRDLLCARCNTRAGGSDDEIPILQATINYIRRHSTAE